MAEMTSKIKKCVQCLACYASLRKLKSGDDQTPLWGNTLEGTSKDGGQNLEITKTKEMLDRCDCDYELETN